MLLSGLTEFTGVISDKTASTHSKLFLSNLVPAAFSVIDWFTD